MATKSVTLDDLDGSEGATTVRFSLGDQTWEIDLTDANLGKLGLALKPFADKAREVVKKNGNGDGEAAAIRAWALRNNIALAPKGRIPADVVDKYRAASTS